MRTSTKLVVGSALSCAVVAILLLAVGAADPAWWTERGVIDPVAPADDYQAANTGQLKHIAHLAHAEMEASLAQFGGAGAAVADMVANLLPGDDYTALTQGQLKYVTESFYDRLIAVGYTNDYPWAAGTPDDWSLINIGQLKNIFSFDLALDTDGDGMPNWWENAHQIDDPSADPDQDGLDNALEFLAGTDPNSNDTDGDGLNDSIDAQPLVYDLSPPVFALTYPTNGMVIP